MHRVDDDFRNDQRNHVFLHGPLAVDAVMFPRRTASGAPKRGGRGTGLKRGQYSVRTGAALPSIRAADTEKLYSR